MRVWLLLMAGAVAGAAGCESGNWLDFWNIPSFREVSAAEGRRIAATPGAKLLQVGADSGLPVRVARAHRVAEADPLPEEIAAAASPVVVLAAEEASARRMAARLARAGIQQVVVVRGGLAAWETEAARAGSPSGEIGG